MGLGFCHVIQVQSSSGFYFLPAKIFVCWLVGPGQLGGMTESLRYLSYSSEASPIGPPTGRGLLYGPSGTQLEGGSPFLMGKLRLLLFCLTYKWTITIYPNFLGVNHLSIKAFSISSVVSRVFQNSTASLYYSYSLYKRGTCDPPLSYQAGEGEERMDFATPQEALLELHKKHLYLS